MMKTILQRLLVVIMIILSSICYTFAEKVKIGDLYYNLDATNHTAEVTYQLSWSENNYSGLTAATIPASVTYDEITYSVTSIGEAAFLKCTGLTSVTIPNSVTSIGSSAFYNCSGLTKVNITDIAAWCNIAFSGSSSNPLYYAKHLYVNDVEVTDLVIPNNVTSIGQYAFYKCTGLTSVTIPNSVTSIGSSAFYNCSGLTSVTIPNSVTSIGSSAFSNCSGLTSVTIPNSVTSIGSSAFYNCSGLTKVNITDIAAWCNITFSGNISNPLYYAKHLYVNDVEVTDLVIPNNVSSIENDAFNRCTGLTSVTIPNSVTSIGNSAFYGCTGLTSIEIPNSVTSIGDFAFSGCTGLTSVEIPNSVTSIGDYAFRGCTGLTSVTIPNSVTSIGKEAFSGCTGLTSVTIGNSVTSIGKEAFSRCSGLTSVAIPNSVISIEDHAFYDCGSLTSVTIGNSVISIGDYAFSYCSGLTSVAIPNSVISIEGHAFYDCGSLTSVTIGNSVISIGDRAFSDCDGLTSVKIDAETPPTLGDYAFGFGFDIYVPCGTLEAYKTAWADYADRIRSGVYTITGKVNDANAGSVDYPTSTCEDVVITAIPNYGYHFTQWSDGLKDNPRTFVLTQDTTFTAEFAKNTYTISTISANPEWGTTAGDKSALYLDVVEITASSNYGYHFVKWNDDNISNPRSFTLAQDTAFTATFAKNVYTITKNAEHGSISGNSSAEYLDYVTLTANPDYGYHFSQWSDGNKENPRIFQMTQDTSFTAEFAINNYTIETQSANPERGIVQREGSYEYLSQQTVTAIPNYGYHFVKWDIDDNTGAISVAQAYAIASALGAGETTTVRYTIVGYVTGTYGTYYNSYYLSDSPNVPGNFIAFKCASSVNIGQYVKVTGYLTNYKGNTPETTSGSTITPNDLSPFTNPCSFTLRSNISFVAEFAKNVYTITLNNAEHGSISGDTSAEYLDEVTLTANPDYGYHFTQWSDGNTDNPRTIVLTQDTTFTAEFAIDKSGTCGANNELTWSYDDQSHTLTITGNGALTSNYTFGLEAPTQMTTLIIGDGVTAIGDEAFYGMSTINHLFIGANVASIGSNAFADCRNFDEITCYSTNVPAIDATTFANVGNKQYIYLYVPEDRERAYHRDEFWGEFDIQIKGTEATTTDTNNVVVGASDNTALFTWPITENANTYSLQITKDGEVFCTLVFNNNGQLTGIAFAPSRDRSSQMPSATMSVSAMSFTVTGLDAASKYSYRLSVTDEALNEIQAYSGEFATTGYEGEINEGGEPEIVDTDGIEEVLNQQSEIKNQKLMIDGQLFILRDGKIFNAQGARVK